MTLVPLAIVTILVGVYPAPLMEIMDSCVAQLVQFYE